MPKFLLVEADNTRAGFETVMAIVEAPNANEIEEFMRKKYSTGRNNFYARPLPESHDSIRSFERRLDKAILRHRYKNDPFALLMVDGEW